MKKIINSIILDDEPFAVKLIEDYAGKISQLNVLYAGSDVYKVIDILNTNDVDLIFLDIQMPELTGMEIMQMFNKKQNFIIISAYQEYALDAYQFHVVDFLLKPITCNRFYQSVEKFVSWQDTFLKTEATDYLFVKADRKHYKVAIESILFIEGLKDYIRIHTHTEKIIVLENMKDILNKLPINEFVRIHRSYIVPFKKIKVIEGNRIQMTNLEYFPIGETYRKLIADWVERK